MQGDALPLNWHFSKKDKFTKVRAHLDRKIVQLFSCMRILVETPLNPATPACNKKVNKYNCSANFQGTNRKINDMPSPHVRTPTSYTWTMAICRKAPKGTSAIVKLQTATLFSGEAYDNPKRPSSLLKTKLGRYHGELSGQAEAHLPKLVMNFSHPSKSLRARL